MSYKPKREGHWNNVTGLFTGDRYVTCDIPGCMRVLRAKWHLKPLIHKGRKYRA
jgi:hypothetical protein